MRSVATAAPSLDQTLTKATLRAGKVLGLNQTEVGAVVGRDRTSLRRGIDPDSKAGELAALLIRLYRSLYALVGGDAQAMRHWMETQNHHTGGIPREQIRTVSGLMSVLEYVDAIRGKL
ncbi:MAG: MbcA/ParS/Xre antitoxin family protein [Gammaproteobacteria bacterium]|nr:MbcA/ParS/Xre antitoxin family protein [Gammaproteobacteria bacterium]